MRRRLWWIGGIILLAVGTLLALAIRPKHDAPFDFLSDYKPVKMSSQDPFGGTWLYSFKVVDYESFEARAREELSERGYIEWLALTALSERHFSGPPPGRSNPATIGPTFAHPSAVTISPGVRYLRDASGKVETRHMPLDQGWVSVRVDGSPPEEEPTFLDRVRSWLGL